MELTEEIAAERGQKIERQEFEKEFEKHKEESRKASAHKFKGGLGGTSPQEIKYHTTTHLLHASLRQILGDHVGQKGSNITPDRLRFDFSHPNKLTPEELKKVEDLINQKIKEDLPIKRVQMPKEKALSEGALAFFPEKYPDITSVYIIGKNGTFFSKELCGGPHVDSTGEIGHVRITKQEKIGSGLVRIYIQKERI